jgi:chromosome segregation ATPase
MKIDDAIFEHSGEFPSEEIRKLRRRLDAVENKIEFLEASAVSIEDLKVLQKQLNELAGLLCDLMQQVDVLREQLGRTLDIVSDLWREVADECRC